MAYDPNVDYAKKIKEIKAVDSNANVNSLIAAGKEKLAANPSLSKYAGAWDALEKQYSTFSTPTAKEYDVSGEIDALARAQRKAAIASLERSRNSALTNLDREKATIQPMYYDKRNQTTTQSQIGAKNFAEYMAARGSANAGSAAQATLSNNLALQGNLGALNRQEQSAFDDIEQRRSGVLNEYEAGLAAAKANSDIAAMQARIQDLQTQRNYARDDARFNQQLNYQTGRDSIADSRYDQEYQDRRADVAWEREWATSENNPAYQAQLLNLRAQDINNQLAQMELDNYPAEQKLRIQQLRKQIAQIGARPPQSAADAEMEKVRLEIAKQELENLKGGLTKSGGIPSGTGDDTTKTEEKYANEAKLQEILDNKGANAGSWIKSNKSKIIAEFGRTYYNNLADEYGVN